MISTLCVNRRTPGAETSNAGAFLQSGPNDERASGWAEICRYSSARPVVLGQRTFEAVRRWWA